MTFQSSFGRQPTDPPAPHLLAAHLDAVPMNMDEMHVGNRLAKIDLDVSLEVSPLGRLSLRRAEGGLLQHINAETISLECAGARVFLTLSAPVLEGILDHHALGAEYPALRSDSRLAAMVLEHLLTPLLDPLEKVTGLPTGLREVALGPADRSGERATLAVTFTMVCDCLPNAVDIALWSDDRRAIGIIEQLEQVLPCDHDPSARKASLDTPVSLSLLAEPQTMTLSELSALEVGDGILCAQHFSPDENLTVAISPYLRAACRCDPETRHIKLSGSFSATPKMTECAMKPSDSKTSAGPVGIEDLPVVLTLELDRMDIPFGGLSELRKGSVVAFPRNSATVSLAANGRPFATGQLVALEQDGTVRHAIQIQSFAAGDTERYDPSAPSSALLDGDPSNGDALIDPSQPG